MATKLTASGSNLLVKMIDPREGKTKKGIIIPAGPRRGETCYGEVKSIGDAVPHTFDPPPVKAHWESGPEPAPKSRPVYSLGTIVVFERSRCYEVPGTTATLAFLPAADVLGTVEFDDAPESVN